MRRTPKGTVLVLLLAACGGAGSEPATPPAAPTTPASKATSGPEPSAAPEGSAAAAAASATPPAHAEGPWPFGPAPSADERAALLDRLKKDPGPLKSNWVPPGKADRYGHAEGLVAAAPDGVRAKLVDFARYKDLAGPKFKQVKVVDKQGQSTDVYFQLPIMKGLVTIWYQTRFAPAKASAAGDVVEGAFVKGNIKGMHIAFTVRPGADDRSAVVVCDLLLQPNVPAPQSAIDEELRDACGDAIVHLRKSMGLP